MEDKINLDKKYDLAISLEVAEHLRPEKAMDFIETLVNAADFVLFSAAIPFQGGKGHINEQWPDYWSALFNEHAYEAVDFIRQRIWNENQIPLWYRQNIVLYVKRDRKSELKLGSISSDNQSFPLAIVHPDAYLNMLTIKGSLKLLRKAMKRWLSTKFKMNI